jgi:hypothetical protein
LPLSTSVNSATSSQFAGIDKAGDGGALGVEPEAGLALPVGRDAIAGDKALHRVKFHKVSARVGNLKGRLGAGLP